MPAGPGKYDDLATYLREKTDADVVLVAIIHGNRGSGFAVQLQNDGVNINLVRVLREMADEIEAST